MILHTEKIFMQLSLTRKRISVGLIAILMFVFMVIRFANLFTHTSVVVEGVMVEGDVGRSWISSDHTDASDGGIVAQWDLISHPRLVDGVFDIKTETDSRSIVTFLNLAEVRLDSLSQASLADDGSLLLRKGRLWGTRFDSGRDAFVIHTPFTSLSISDRGSFWVEVLSDEVVQVSSVLGSLDVIAHDGSDVFFDQEILSGEAITLTLHDGEPSVSFELLQKDTLVELSDSFDDAVRLNLQHTGTEDSHVQQIRRASEGVFIEKPADVNLYGEGEEFDFGGDISVSSSDASAQYEPGVGTQIDSSGDDSGDVHFGEVIANDVQDNVNPNTSINTSVHINTVIGEGALIAKWYYTGHLDGGPVYVDIQTITEPGDYSFNFPIHAKPTFLVGDEWPSGEYLVKISFDGKVVREYSVFR